MKEELQKLVIDTEKLQYKRRIYSKLFILWLSISSVLITLIVFIESEIKRCYPPSCIQPLRHSIDDLYLITTVFLTLPLLVIIIILVFKLEEIKN